MKPSKKKLLKALIIERATRKYFIEKMRAHLSTMWKAGQTANKMFIETNERYEMFRDKVSELDELIFKLVPPNTHYEQLEYKITD